jgi:hypothetical protein
MMSRLLLVVCIACGPSVREQPDCVGAACTTGPCEPGDSRTCYTADGATNNVGPCHGGMQQCTAGGQWGTCDGERVPMGESCTDVADNNCNGRLDEGDPGAYDVEGDLADNDCDGTIDNPQGACDQGLASSSANATDFAKAIDICQMTTPTDEKWGLLAAALTLADGTGSPDPNSHSIRPKFGSNVTPQKGSSVALISSGGAAAKGDTNPPYRDFVSYQTTKSSPFPADFVAANGGTLPNAPGCPEPEGTVANDPVMLTLELRVPTNARSFSLRSNFFSSEFPEYTCSAFNDFFVVLIDSMSMDNPPDKNLAFYTPPGATTKVPVGVNLGYGNTGLFTQCTNGATGCAQSGPAGSISTCTGTDDLLQTGFDDPSPAQCDGNSLKGGATGWLTTSGNVVPGELIKLRIAIWDTSDRALDSLAVIDGFAWSAEPATPGTVILKGHL